MVQNRRYHPGPDYELVKDIDGMSVNSDVDAWLLQFPHYWDASIKTELHMHAAGKGGLTTGTCKDDEGAQYAVSARAEALHMPTYAVFPDSSDVLRPIKQRATVIRSDDIVKLFSTSPTKPAASPIKLKSVAAGPALQEVVQPDITQLQPQLGDHITSVNPSLHKSLTAKSGFLSPTETPNKNGKRNKKRKASETEDLKDLAAETKTAKSEKKKKRKRDKEARRQSEL